MIVEQIVVFDVSLVKTRYRSVRILISVERKEVIGVIGDRVAREAGTKEKKKTQLIFFIIGLKKRKKGKIVYRECWKIKERKEEISNFDSIRNIFAAKSSTRDRICNFQQF